MKRVIFAAVLLAFTCFICILGNFIINKNCNNVKEDLKEIKTVYVKDKEKSEKLCAELSKEWEKKQKILALFSNHSLLDGISNEIATMPTSIKFENKDEFYMSVAKTERLLTQIIEEERVTLQSFY